MGVVEQGGVLDGEYERMRGHAFERALLMRQQDLSGQPMRIGKEGVGGLGRLPIGARLINRRLRAGAKRFGKREQAPIQARIAQVDAVELTNTLARINVFCHWLLHQVRDCLARKCTAQRRRCHITQQEALSQRYR